jgi:hypothetical protein
MKPPPPLAGIEGTKHSPAGEEGGTSFLIDEIVVKKCQDQVMKKIFRESLYSFGLRVPGRQGVWK